jgi:hypothetical protein
MGLLPPLYKDLRERKSVLPPLQRVEKLQRIINKNPSVSVVLFFAFFLTVLCSDHLHHRHQLEDPARAIKRFQQAQLKISNLELNKKEKEKINRLVTGMILQDGLPLSFVERPGFQRLIQYLKPGYHLVGRTQQRERCMDMSESINAVLMDYIRDAGYYAMS